MTLRPAQLADLPYLYEICHLTGDNGSDASPLLPDRTMLGQYFAAPYLVRDRHWCWVVADDAGPAGYLVATPNTAAFSQWMDREWLPGLRQLFPQRQDATWSPTELWIRKLYHETPGDSPFPETHPAHLHIDLLKRAQGQGWGTRLISAFLDQLRQESVPGFHLGVGIKNTGAHVFYRKQGFQVLKEETWGTVFGLSVS